MTEPGAAEVPVAGVAVFGAGRVGSALAALFGGRGIPVCGIWSRSGDSARSAAAFAGLDRAWAGPELPQTLEGADVVVLAVRDDAVMQMSADLLAAGLLGGVRAIYHCGGARAAADVVAPAGEAARGTFHPLVAVTDGAQGCRTIPGACVAVEGDRAAVELGKLLAVAIGARPMKLKSDQLPLYHAAAVVASNHTVALWDTAAALMQEAGFGADEALAALVPLLHSTLDNLAHTGLPDALTGPIRRGDVETIRQHLVALEQHPCLAEVYRAGSRACLRTAARCAPPPARGALEAIAALCATKDED